jgi:hypothetical protein
MVSVELAGFVFGCEMSDCLSVCRHMALACRAKTDPADMEVYRPTGEESFDGDETTEEAVQRRSFPSRVCAVSAQHRHPGRGQDRAVFRGLKRD